MSKLYINIIVLLFSSLLFISCGSQDKPINYNDLFIDDLNPKLDNSEFFQKNMAKKQINETDRLIMIKKIIESGTPVDTLDKNGDTPLYKSVRYGFSEISEYLIKNGANVNYSQNENETMLWSALINSNYQINRDIVKLLIKNGANKDIMIKYVPNDLTPIEYINDRVNTGTPEFAELKELFE